MEQRNSEYSTKNEQSLIAAFLSTNYHVDQLDLTIRVGRHHAALDRLLEQHSCSSWVYLTAVNPGSRQLAPDENRTRNKGLKMELIPWKIFSGRGVAQSGDWPPEESWLILGLTISDARLMAVKWEQLAFLYGEVGQPAQLIWCG